MVQRFVGQKHGETGHFPTAMTASSPSVQHDRSPDDGRAGISSWLAWGFIGLILFVGLFFLSRFNYLWFHSLVELFGIAVTAALFLLVWNARRFIRNDAVVCLAIAYLFVGLVDLTHTLGYKGMGVFPGIVGSNVATQLWIGGRFLESFSLLLFPLLFGRRIRIAPVFAGYALVTVLLLAAVFRGSIFPDCYVEGVGLTPFKKGSEYTICLILIASLLLLRRRRDALDSTVYRLLAASIVVSIFTELAFTLYTDVYGFLNFLGHCLKILSFFLIYLAFVRSGLTRPYSLLFRELKEREEELRSLLDATLESMALIDTDGKILECNRTFSERLGYSRRDVIGTDVYDSLPADLVSSRRERIAQMKETRKPIQFEDLRSGRYMSHSLYPVLNPDGDLRAVAIYAEDITDRKTVMQELKASNVMLEALWGVASLVDADLQEISDYILSTIAKMTRSAYGFYGFVNQDESEMTIHSWSGEAMKDCSVVNNPCLFPIVEAGVWAEAIRQRKPFLLNDYALPHAAKMGLPEGHVEIKNLLVVPFFLDGRIASVAAVANRDTDYSESDITQITTFLTSIHSVVEKRRAEIQLEKTSWLLESIRSVQTEFIKASDPGPTLERLLNLLVEMTESQFGFLDELRRDADGTIYKVSLDLSNILWDEKSQALYEDLRSHNLEFRNLANLAGAPAVTGQIVIANDPPHDTRSGGLPEGHPTIECFMGIPLYSAGELVGVAGVANRPGGYDEEIASFLDPFSATCAGIIRALQSRRYEEQMTQALLESEERFKVLVEAAPISVAAVREGRFVFVNAAAAKQLGYQNTGELVGLQAIDFSVPAFRETIRKQLIEGRRDREIETKGIQIVKRDGSTGWMELRYNLVTLDGKRTLLLIGSDITDRKRHEEQIRRSLEEKETLLREIHHRVKNNMQIIMSLLRMHARRSESPDSIEALMDCMERVQAMAIAHEVLYRSERLAEVNAAEYVPRLCDALSATYGGGVRRRIAMKVAADKVALSIDQAVPMGLTITELVTNAYRHAFPGDTEGEISVHVQELESGEIEAGVWDNGIGLPSDIDPSHCATLGLGLVVATVENQLEGTWIIERDAGTRIAFRFKQHRV